MEDPRLKDIIKQYSDINSDFHAHVAIVGFPFDEGVRRNGGRIGAASGPDAFRKYMYRLCASEACSDRDFRKLKIVDYGNVETSNNSALEEAHEKLTQRVFELLSQGSVPFVLGGGNDQSYANVHALLKYAKSQNNSILVINIDAHLDVRPLKEGKVHSGSPFRLMLENPLFKQCNGRFIEFAAQAAQCSLEHKNYLGKRSDSVIYWLEDLLRNGDHIVAIFEQILRLANEDLIFVSFDLDSVRASDAPGVSCGSPDGLSARDALQICRLAGGDARVRLFDLSEYNPMIEEYQTGRLTAFMFHSFISAREI